MRPTGMARTSWIWLAGCIAWTVDGFLQMRIGQTPHVRLAFAMAALFFVAWLFYRVQPPKR